MEAGRKGGRSRTKEDNDAGNRGGRADRIPHDFKGRIVPRRRSVIRRSRLSHESSYRVFRALPAARRRRGTRMKQLALDIGLAAGPTLAGFFAGPNEPALLHLQLWVGGGA